jgi:hypothetical protein
MDLERSEDVPCHTAVLSDTLKKRRGQAAAAPVDCVDSSQLFLR